MNGNFEPLPTDAAPCSKVCYPTLKYVVASIAAQKQLALELVMLEWFPRAVGLVVIFFWASQSAANSLGLAPPERWPKRYFGQNAQISDTGELRFDWFDPFSNEPKVVSFQQMDVGDVPDKVRPFSNMHINLGVGFLEPCRLLCFSK